LVVKGKFPKKTSDFFTPTEKAILNQILQDNKKSGFNANLAKVQGLPKSILDSVNEASPKNRVDVLKDALVKAKLPPEAVEQELQGLITAPEVSIGAGEESTLYTTGADLLKSLEPIEWDWRPWLPKGFFTLVVAMSGTGKSAVCMQLAATYTRGVPWFDKSSYTGEPGSVVWCETEAGQGLLRDRIEGYDLPPEKLLFPGNDALNDFQLDDDESFARLEKMAKLPNVRLVVVDSHRGSYRGDENDSGKAFAISKQLAVLARDTGKPVVVTHHLRKRHAEEVGPISLDRVRGATALVQPARMIWAIDIPDKQDEEALRLSVIKSNLARYPEPLGIKILDTGVIPLGYCPSEPKKITRKEEARRFLRETLQPGEPMEALKIKELAAEHGIALKTLNEASTGIVKKQKMGSGCWTWELLGGGGK